MLLPGEERPRHEEAVQTPEVQPAEGGEVREEGQQRRLRDAAPRQGQALQLRPQTQTHLERERENTRAGGYKYTQLGGETDEKEKEEVR